MTRCVIALDYPAPGQRPQQHPREPAQSERSHPSVEYEGRKAQAALSIVSFQVAGEMRGEEAESVQQLTKQDADEPIDTLEPSTKSQPDDSQQDFEQLVLSPPTINEGSEELPGAAMPESEAVTELAEDGSFDLTVSSVLAASDNHRPRLPDAMESEEGMSLPNMALVEFSFSYLAQLSSAFRPVASSRPFSRTERVSVLAGRGLYR